MDGDRRRIEALIKAASNLADARRSDAATGEDWDALEWALLDATEADVEPDWTFRDRRLVRTGTLVDGSLAEVACGIADFEQAALAIDGFTESWFTVDEVAEACERDWMVACIVVMFLIRSGLVRQNGTGRRLLAIEGFDVEAAIAEYAIAEMRSRGA